MLRWCNADRQQEPSGAAAPTTRTNVQEQDAASTINIQETAADVNGQAPASYPLPPDMHAHPAKAPCLPLSEARIIMQQRVKSTSPPRIMGMLHGTHTPRALCCPCVLLPAGNTSRHVRYINNSKYVRHTGPDSRQLKGHSIASGAAIPVVPL